MDAILPDAHALSMTVRQNAQQCKNSRWEIRASNCWVIGKNFSPFLVFVIRRDGIALDALFGKWNKYFTNWMERFLYSV
ncbi:hypothetical protein [Phyllobacterium myrsinacearum]|uniref:Uncharacterized protein n=1 Tax=Phyllobacterium myrsinacearum TaxID=28101 RepID=A0A839EW90_9HYPH|nr:hypothetical protein [Phyllobacterium myrsinacearum]MBA8880677.1 hypothetical protein [Phyllobacterium myrsinacearum]